MPSSTCWPWSDSRQRTSVSVSSANQSMRSPTRRCPTLLIQPPRLVEVPTSGETVTARAATSGASRSRSTQKRPNACWVDSRPGARGRATPAPRAARRRAPAARSSRAPARSHSSASGEPAANDAHGSSGSAPSRGAELGELLVGEQRRVVGGMALGRQPPALDRVGEDDARAVADGVGLAVAVDQRREVVAAEVAERGQQLALVEARRVDLEALAQLARVGAQQPLVLLVGHRVDARAQRRAGAAAAAPYLTITQCQPAASNIAARRPAAMSGTTRSSDWRLRSTTHMTSPSLATIGSAIASQQAPSSSSASPISAIWRPPTGTSKCPAT